MKYLQRMFLSASLLMLMVTAFVNADETEVKLTEIEKTLLKYDKADFHLRYHQLLEEMGYSEKLSIQKNDHLNLEEKIKKFLRDKNTSAIYRVLYLEGLLSVIDRDVELILKTHSDFGFKTNRSVEDWGKALKVIGTILSVGSIGIGSNIAGEVVEFAGNQMMDVGSTMQSSSKRPKNKNPGNLASREQRPTEINEKVDISFFDHPEQGYVYCRAVDQKIADRPSFEILGHRTILNFKGQKIPVFATMESKFTIMSQCVNIIQTERRYKKLNIEDVRMSIGDGTDKPRLPLRTYYKVDENNTALISIIFDELIDLAK